ncbi:hypothetical protein ZIOFF_066027 [Zingiber officinale]|uniref:TFIIS N-terminal domain-containing protein n=1 Tax=Zingiber officinale TaxID=94328 RepID=A0A8J5EY33_ZINOF|nr:hypothetical protein ZIOFF_066027 [Zingiber officinale]
MPELEASRSSSLPLLPLLLDVESTTRIGRIAILVRAPLDLGGFECSEASSSANCSSAECCYFANRCEKDGLVESRRGFGNRIVVRNRAVAMEEDGLRRLMRSANVDLWSLIDTAISVAAAEHGEELRARRDGIVQRLYASDGRCGNCGGSSGARSGSPVAAKEEEVKGRSSPWEKRIATGEGTSSTPSPESMNNAVGVVVEEEEEEEEEEQEEDVPRSYGHSIEEVKRKILAIKQFLEDTDQPEDSLVSLLQNLADMDITFKTLKETDIGRYVNNHRKHPSNEVRQLVKQLVRKWKDLVDEWAKSNSANGTASPAIITNGDSPLQIYGRSSQNSNQMPEFGNSPNPHAVGYLSTERNSSEPIEPKAKKPTHNPARNNGSSTRPPSSSASLAVKRSAFLSSLFNSQDKFIPIIPVILISTRRQRKRRTTPRTQSGSLRPGKDFTITISKHRMVLLSVLPHSFFLILIPSVLMPTVLLCCLTCSAAKKQRTIQVMDIHEIPKPKNSFVRKGVSHGKH